MSSTRLLPLLLLLSLPSVAPSQDRRPTIPVAPGSCPVTKPADRPFVPPAPHPAEPSVGQFWFGTDRLWTALPVSGTWRLGHYTPSDPTFRQKLLFWRQGYDAQTEPQPNLTVSGKRIDAVAPPLQTDGKGNGSWTNKDDQFIMTGINFPTAGCWEITGRYDDDEVIFVVWVSP
jgi:hypothetical protein